MRDPQNFFTADDFRGLQLRAYEPNPQGFADMLNSKICESLGPKVFGEKRKLAGAIWNETKASFDTHSAHLFCIEEIKNDGI